MVLGNDITEGMNIVGAHIDSPRLDVKQMPLYEDSNLAFLKTHYYGGIKKYQWTAIPLAIHGVIFTKEGKKIEICIGEDENDPVFFINDLLIHLSKKQLQETLAEGITAEQLNVLVGNMKPAAQANGKKEKDEKPSPVKENVLKILISIYFRCIILAKRVNMSKLAKQVVEFINFILRLPSDLLFITRTELSKPLML